MDSIESAQVDEDGTIEAIAIDEGAKFVCRYQNGAIEIKALNPDQEPKTAGFAAGKTRTCKTGISCGGSCISKTKTCGKKGTSGQAEKAKEIAAEVNQPVATAKKSEAKAKPSSSEKTGETRKSIPAKAEEKKISDAIDYANAVNKTGSDKDFYRDVSAHLNMNADRKETAAKLMAKGGGKSPTPEQQAERKKVLAQADRMGKRTEIEQSDNEDAYRTGIVAYLTADSKKRELLDKVIELKPKPGKGLSTKALNKANLTDMGELSNLQEYRKQRKNKQ